MANTEIYIGTRIDWETLNNTLNRSVSRLNQKLTKELRTVALNKGIKKTEQGKRLDLYSVSQQELDTLMNEASVRPLVKVDAKKMSDSLQKVNASYSGRMDYDTAKLYKKDLTAALTSSLDVIGEDTNERKKVSKVSIDNPYKVGDWVSYSNNYGYDRGYARISKLTPKGYYLEYPLLKYKNGEFMGKVTNYDFARIHFNNVQGKSWDQEWDWTIPYEGNEDMFFFKKSSKFNRLSNSEYSNPPIVNDELHGYRSYRYQYD